MAPHLQVNGSIFIEYIIFPSHLWTGARDDLIADLDDERSFDRADGGISDGDGLPSLTRMTKYLEIGIFAIEQGLKIPCCAAKYLSGLARQDHNIAKSRYFISTALRDRQIFIYCNR